MFSKQSGFTLVELVVVIVILGLLAATALPRFINITREARIASVDGVAGGLRSAISLAKAQYIVNGSTAATTVTMDGTPVDVIVGSGHPQAGSGTPGGGSGIVQAMQSTDGYAVAHPDASTTTFRPTNGGSAGCQAAYSDTTGAVTTSTASC